MQRSFTAQVCVSCAWFTYGMDGHCHTVVGCALQQAQLQQGQHLTHCCRNWKAVHKVDPNDWSAPLQNTMRFDAEETSTRNQGPSDPPKGFGFFTFSLKK